MPPHDPQWKPRDPRAAVGRDIEPKAEAAPRGTTTLVHLRPEPPPPAFDQTPALAVLAAMLRDALGHGWHPRVDAERTADGWRGWFVVGHKRFAMEVRLDYGPTPEGVVEELREEVAEAENASRAAIEEREDMEKEAERLKDRLSEWEPTVSCALDGDGEGAVEEAQRIPRSERP